MYLRKLSCCSVSAVFRHCSPLFAGRVSDFLFRVINLRPGLNQTSNVATQPRSQPCDVITRTSHGSVMYYVVRPRANESQNYTRGDTILFFSTNKRQNGRNCVWKSSFNPIAVRLIFTKIHLTLDYMDLRIYGFPGWLQSNGVLVLNKQRRIWWAFSFERATLRAFVVTAAVILNLFYEFAPRSYWNFTDIVFYRNPVNAWLLKNYFTLITLKQFCPHGRAEFDHEYLEILFVRR